jgi:hypothetical protein
LRTCSTTYRRAWKAQVSNNVYKGKRYALLYPTFCLFLVSAQTADDHKEQLKGRVATSESRLKNAIKSAAIQAPAQAELEALKVIIILLLG